MPAPEDIRAHLKDAKVALKNQEFEAAAKACRMVLRVSPDNYNALVLEGAALQHMHKYNQSLASFKKAASICPNSLLAYQGIVSHYEKQNIQKHDDLLEAYKNISRFYETDKDDAKFIETTLKFAGALQSQGDFEKCVHVLARLIKSRGNNVQIAQMAIGALTQIKEISPDQENLMLSCLGVLHETQAATNDQYRKYFQILYKQGEFSKLEAVCLDLQPNFNSFYHPIDYLCRLFLEKNVSENTKYIMPNFVDKLFKLYPSSTFGYFAQGKILFEHGKVLDAISWLKQGLESKLHQDALELLVTALLTIWDFEGVEEQATRALKLQNLKDPGFFYHALAQGYIGQEKNKEAMGILDNVGSDLNMNILKAKILAGENHWNELAVFLVEMEKYDNWNFDFLRAHGKRENLLSLCENDNENFNLLLLSGIELSKLDDFESAIGIFSKCMDIFPKHPALLTYIAGFYRLEGENDTALKYLLTAYDALPSQEIGIILSDLYFDIEDFEANKELLKKAARKSKKSKSKWAWLRLGMLHLQLGESDEAVVALQAAIRTDYSDSNLWETLADAYYSRGSYEAALKTFDRAIQLGAEPTYPKLKMGVIYEHLGEGDLALATLSQLGDYIPAVLEIAKSWLLIARKKFNEGLTTAVVDAVEEAIRAATRVIQSSEQALALTIISEVCLIGGDLDPRNTYFRIPSILVTNQECAEFLSSVDSRQLITVGINCTSLIISNSPSKYLAGFLHSLLAKLYHLLALRHSSDTLGRGLYHAKKAVSLDPSNYTYWNLVGIIAEANGEGSLAQHALIKSISLNSTGNAVAWTNLGFLALHHKEIMKGHACFSEAQRFQPSYGLCWVGQGLVAENYNIEEATDISRHAASLEDTHIYSGLFYADWVCRALEAPDKNSANYNYFMEHLDSTHVSLEKIALFNRREPTVVSMNLEGILRMHTGQYGAGLRAFEQASELTNKKEELGLLIRNQITALQKLGKYQESLVFLSSVSEVDFQMKAAAALGLHKGGVYDHAFNLYEDLVVLCGSDESNRIHEASVLIAQGITAYRMDDIENAMTLLFRGSELSSTPEGHIALCSIALISGNLEFAQSVVTEMKSKYIGQEYLHQIAVLNAFCLYGQGQEKKAVRSMLSHIHMYPRNGKLWNALSHYLINVDVDGCRARHALLTAHRLGEGLTLPGVALTHLMESNFEEGLKQAQIALAHEPTSLPALATMAASLSYTSTPSNKFLNHSIQLARKALNITETEVQNHDLFSSQIRDWFCTFLLHYTSLS